MNFPNEKYCTILADPPWPYNQKLGRPEKGDSTRGGLPYLEMTIEEIYSLPIKEISMKDCIIGLWTTNSHIHEALHTLKFWGFEYKTMTTWVKTNFGLGYWLRGQTEHLLIGVKGKPRKGMIGPHGATGTNWSTFLGYFPRTKHSEKPIKAYELLESIGEEPRIELFSRKKRDGWDSWGNEVSEKEGLFV